MIFLKVIILSFLTISFIANGNAVNINRLSEGIKHSEDVSVCLIETVEEIKKSIVKSLSNTSYLFEVKRRDPTIKKRFFNWPKKQR